MKPRTHLKVDGDFSQNTESAESFVHPRVQQQMQPADIELTGGDPDEEDGRTRDEEEKRRKDEEMKMLVSKLEELNGRPFEIPEYRDAYKVNSPILFYIYDWFSRREKIYRKKKKKL